MLFMWAYLDTAGSGRGRGSMASPRGSRGAKVNLADVMHDRDPYEEPCRDQPAILDGTKAIVMLAVLDRTVVVELNGDRVVVPHHRFDVDPHQLRWQRKAEPLPRQAWRRPSKARSESA
jgi:hypothetical protein